VSTASKAVPLRGLKRRALSLGAAKAFDYAMQFLLPVVLVRCMDTATFGEYRLLWLAVGTLLGLASLNMPQSLYLFLPPADAPTKRLYINQTVLFLALAGLAGALLVSPLNPWLPKAMAPLMEYGWLVPAFIALWVVAYMLEFLPTVDERIAWQSAALMSLSVLRVTMLGVGAFLTGSMEVVLWLLVAFVLVKLSLLFAYIARYHGVGRPLVNGAHFRRHVTLAAPFGFSSALFGLRTQVDQWIAAHLFSLSSFAAFSIAPLLGAMVNVFRTSVSEVFLPSMSRLTAAGDPKAMVALNGRANVMVGTLLYPALAFAFAFADEIITFIYTSAYIEAVPVMRLYIVGFAVAVIEMGSLVLLLEEGKFHLKVNAVVLALSATLSFAAALHFGLVGAAAGGVTGLFLDRAAMLRRVSQRTGIPMRGMQDWRGLGLALAFGALSGGLAWGVAETWLAGASVLERLIAGGAVLAACYGAILLYLRRKG
jgi:O-antigen/teichoic acid export membrane protein